MLACGLFGGEIITAQSGDCGEMSVRTASHTAVRFTSLRGKRSCPACEEDAVSLALVIPVDKTRIELSSGSLQRKNPTMDKFWLLCGSTGRRTEHNGTSPRSVYSVK